MLEFGCWSLSPSLPSFSLFLVAKYKVKKTEKTDKKDRKRLIFLEDDTSNINAKW